MIEICSIFFLHPYLFLIRLSHQSVIFQDPNIYEKLLSFQILRIQHQQAVLIYFPLSTAESYVHHSKSTANIQQILYLACILKKCIPLGLHFTYFVGSNKRSPGLMFFNCLHYFEIKHLDTYLVDKKYIENRPPCFNFFSC